MCSAESHPTEVLSPGQRAALMGHSSAIVWFTGLSGAGKSTIARVVEQRLYRLGIHTVLLDGDDVRRGLSRDLGFSRDDRVENVRRVAEVARIMADAGVVVLVSLISPFRCDRASARRLAGNTYFLEVFVDAPLNVVERRDVKGYYARAREGRLENFTGFDSPYEAPIAPDLHLDTGGAVDPAACAEQVLAALGRISVTARTEPRPSSADMLSVEWRDPPNGPLDS